MGSKANHDFVYESARNIFKKTLLNDLKNGNLDGIPMFCAVYAKHPGSEGEKRTVTDQTLRDLIHEKTSSINNMKTVSKTESLLDVITVSVSVAKQSYCAASTPFILLGDILDCFTLDVCDTIFHYIEERVAVWKSDEFYTAGKNFLLRMCNDLLRRLSQSQNTVFCGRIQLFLARLFPLSEKSALNLVSQFNLDNVTVYNKDPNNTTIQNAPSKANGKSDDKMDVDALDITVDSSDLITEQKNEEIVDFRLYLNIWSLQDLFRSPQQCYNQELWGKFIENANNVFRVFRSYKLEESCSSTKTASTRQPRAYFAKFLTSEKLMNLQLSDGMFRRQLLTQFLILFQYLTSTVKFKSASLVLTEAQKTWIKETEAKIYALLDETPPNGKRFTKYIKHVLAREEYWISWKNDGCPSFMKTKKKASEPASPSTAKRRKLSNKISSIADDFVAGKPLGLGSAELTRLWNFCPDNLEACRSTSREFLPSLQDYFTECVEQEDPLNQIEDQYKLIKNPNFQWKALRLLSARSQLFFTNPQAQFKAIPEYLSTIVNKLAKDFPSTDGPESPEVTTSKPEVENGEISQLNDHSKTDLTADEDETNEADPEDDDAMLDGDGGLDDEALLNDAQEIDSSATEQTTGSSALDALSNDDISSFAEKIGADWKKLAPQLSITAKDMKEIEEDSDDAVLQARQTLVTWQDMANTKATWSALIQALKSSGLEKHAKDE